MKAHRVFFGYIASIVMILVAISSIPSNGYAMAEQVGSAQPEPDFYYYKDQRIPLHPVPGKVAVRLQPTVTSAQLPALIGGGGTEATMEAAPLGWYLVQTNAEEVRGALSQADRIERTVPVYRADDGTEFFIPDQFFVQFNPSVSEEEIRALNAQYGVLIVEKIEWLGNNYLLQVSDQANRSALELANLYHESPLTEYAAPNFIRFVLSSAVPNDTYYGDQWALSRIGAPSAWDISTGSPNVKVAVLDEGVDLNHEDLDGSLTTGFDETDDPDHSPQPRYDRDGHGTSVAGIIAAESNNSQGVAGMAPAVKIMPIQIFYSASPWQNIFCRFLVINDSWIVNGFHDAMNNGADVISNSWGGGAPSPAIESAIVAAAQQGRNGKGSIVVFASGNFNTGVSFPATINEVLAVGATTEADRRATPSDWGSGWLCGLTFFDGGSNYGPELDVVAPGNHLWTTDIMGSGGYNSGDTSKGDGNGNYYNAFAGTSGAAPYVSGLAALILSVNPNLTGEQVKQIIQDTADKVSGYTYDANGWNSEVGYGRINAQKALQAARGDGAIRTGFDTNTLSANDDGSTGLVDIGFPINFLGDTYNRLYVNNNGNVTFDAALGEYTPFGLTSTSRIIIAPFFADVDTRAGSVVTYGQGIVGDRPAFGVNWPDVGCYATITSVLNNFQLVLVDRSDRGPGDFDIEFNYKQIQWETGQASGGNQVCQGGSSVRVGYSNGTSTSFELPGSGINGAFLDSNQQTGLIHNSRNSLQPGRYIFEVRNGIAPTGGTISGNIFANSTANPVNGAFVQVCGGGGFCNTTTTNASGQYSVSGLDAGQYNVTAFPPGGTNLEPGTLGPLNLAGDQSLTGQDIILTGPTPPPTGTMITNRSTGGDGLPVVYWQEDLTLTTQGCAGGMASYTISQDGVVARSGSMAESPTGIYSAIVPQLYPFHGYAHVAITIACPNTGATEIQFDIYIDPSGHVRTVGGSPITGATVTLFRSDSSSGPFDLVLNGSGIMSLANRNNPDVTDIEGRFGWDVVAGYYIVRAEAVDCHAPGNPAQAFVESAVLPIPPPVTDLDLRLECQATADLILTKAAEQNPVTVGQSLTYNLTVVNQGPSDAAGVTVIDTLPAGVAFVSATPSQGNCAEVSSIITCSLSALANGANATITIVVTSMLEGTIVNTATVTSDTSDPDADNNSDDAQTFVQLPTSTATSTPTLVPTSPPTPTFTATPTSAVTAVDTPTFTATSTPTVTPTFTVTPSTSTATPTPTPTARPTSEGGDDVMRIYLPVIQN